MFRVTWTRLRSSGRFTCVISQSLVAKALLYRLSSWLITFAIVLALTRSLPKTTLATLLIEGGKTLWYYVYDLLWEARR